MTKDGEEKPFVLSGRKRHRRRGEAKSYSLQHAPVSVHEELMEGIDAILANKTDV